MDEVSELEGQVEKSLRELFVFFLGRERVAAGTSKEVDEYRIWVF